MFVKVLFLALLIGSLALKPKLNDGKICILKGEKQNVYKFKVYFAKLEYFSCEDTKPNDITKIFFTHDFWWLDTTSNSLIGVFNKKVDELTDNPSIGFGVDDRLKLKSLISDFTYTVTQGDVLSFKLENGHLYLSYYRNSSPTNLPLYEKGIVFTQEKFKPLIDMLKAL